MYQGGVFWQLKTVLFHRLAWNRQTKRHINNLIILLNRLWNLHRKHTLVNFALFVNIAASRAFDARADCKLILVAYNFGQLQSFWLLLDFLTKSIDKLCKWMAYWVYLSDVKVAKVWEECIHHINYVSGVNTHFGTNQLVYVGQYDREIGFALCNPLPLQLIVARQSVKHLLNFGAFQKLENQGSDEG